MPPRRANRHQNVEALYRREEADEMEQRINENFSEKLNEGIGRLEKLMTEMNQNRRRVSPESNHGGSRVSPHSNRDRSVENDQGRGRNVNGRERRNVDRREEGGRRNGSKDVGGQNRHRYASDFEEEYDGGSVQGRGQGRNYSEYDHKWESGMKTEIPEFKGGMQAEEFLDWVANVEEIFDFKEVPEHRRVKLVATRLRGRDLAWWQQTKLTCERMGKSKVESWEKMKKLMKATFLPYNYQSLMYQRLQNLRQGTKTVNDYVDEFYQLIARNDIMETEEQLTSRFIGGLRMQIQDIVNMFDPRSVAEAHQKALAWEKQGRRGSGVFTNSNNQAKGVGGSSNVTIPISRPVVKEVEKAMVNNGFKCYNCQEVGHKSNECPKPKKRTMIVEVEDEDAEAEGYNSLHDEEEENVLGDEGYTLMMKRSCLTPKQEEETSWLRSNIFQSTCTILGRVCKFVIDAGSCDNIISTEAVKKLELKTEKHPKPYKLAWLRKGGEVKVGRRACVKFSIGKKYIGERVR